jgi:diguanylate cyclase (GGDEF)-like protein
MDAAAALAAAEAAKSAGDIAAGLAAAEAARAAGAGWPAERLLAFFRFRSGALGAVVEHGVKALPLAATAPPDERFDFLRTLAVAAMEGGRFDVALPAAEQALALVQGGSNHGRLALALNALACCFERMGDPWQAERMMVDALVAARASDETHPLLATLNNLVAVEIGMFHLMRDAATPEVARAPLERALPHALEATRYIGETDPFVACFVTGNLGEVLLHLGRLDDARRALGDAFVQAERIGARANTQHMAYALAELDLADGRPDAAWSRLNGVLAESSLADVRATQLRVHHALWRCARALGRSDDALQHLEQYLRLERERSLEQLRSQSELFVTRAENEQARHESRRDQLTQLGNRREAELRWPQLLDDARARGTPLAVALADLDHFKRINDRFGHAVGDQVLVALAGILRDNTRHADLVARMGGEEFLLVLPDTPTERAREVCERLRQRVAAWDWERIAPGLDVTLSVGLTAAPPFDAAALTARADAALYRAKAAGRDRVVVAL